MKIQLCENFAVVSCTFPETNCQQFAQLVDKALNLFMSCCYFAERVTETYLKKVQDYFSSQIQSYNCLISAGCKTGPREYTAAEDLSVVY